MDYILVSTLAGASLSRILLIYDIACQWVKNLTARLTELETLLCTDFEGVTLMPAIPKGHINAHGKHCQTCYSLNFLPGSARMDGEGVENGVGA